MQKYFLTLAFQKITVNLRFATLYYVNFSTVIPDIDSSKLSESEKEKHQKRLDKYNIEVSNDNEILSKDYSKLNKKDKLQYDKIKLKVDERNKNFEEERNESSEKLRLWNKIKDRFPKLF
jgi:hypothetical protein